MGGQRTDVTIRRMGRGDLQGTLDLVNQAIAETHAHFGTELVTLEAWTEKWSAQQERWPWLVAEVDGGLAGFAHAGRFRGRPAYAWLTEVTVYVAPRLHGRGVGRALYDALLPLLEAQGFREALGVIALPNAASEALHAACGFRRAGSLVRAGHKKGTWHDVALWQKHLGPADDSPPAPLRPVGDVLPGDG